MEQNLKGLGVGGEDDKFRDTTVEGLGGWIPDRSEHSVGVRADMERTFVSTLLQLLVLSSLLNDFENLFQPTRTTE